MLPDAVAGNGVRRGNGTEDDPYVIANWTISGDNQDAITLRDVESYIVLRDLRLTQSTERAGSSAIELDNTPHVRIESVNVTGWQQHGIRARDAGFAVTDSRFAVTESQAGNGKGPPGGIAVSCHASNVTVRDTTFVGEGQSLMNFGRGPPHACHRIVFDGNTLIARTTDSSGVFYATESVRITNNTGPATYHLGLAADASRATIRDNTLAGATVSRGRNASVTGQRVMKIVDNRFNGSPAGQGQVNGLSFGPVPGWRFLVKGNRFANYPGGISAKDAVTVVGNVFVNNGGEMHEPLIRVRADADAYRRAEEANRSYQTFKRNDLLRAPDDEDGFGVYYQVHGAGGGARMPLDMGGNYWGPQPPVVTDSWPPPAPPPPQWGIVGPVDFDPWSTTPNVLSESFVESYFSDNTGNPLPAPHPAAVLTTLLIAALATAATRRD